ncbi:MAG: hypothetical protein HOQ44_19800 [Nocardia sp.]|nr:hypothetical protein [Nocardia sp.]
MNALIIVAIVLVAVGLLITVILWLRTPDTADSEYVTVAELQARLEHEQEPEEQAAAGEPDEQADTAGTTEPERTAPDDASVDLDSAGVESAGVEAREGVETPREPTHLDAGARPTGAAAAAADDVPGAPDDRTPESRADAAPGSREEPGTGQPDRNR